MRLRTLIYAVLTLGSVAGMPFRADGRRFAAEQPVAQCSAEQQQRWTAAAATLGATVSNDSSSTGTRVPKRWGQPNWFPVDSARHLVCGDINKTSLYYAVAPRNERDFHVYVIPSRAHEFIVRDLPNPAARSVRTCDDTPEEDNDFSDDRPCLFGEITAPDAFSREMFERDNGLLEVSCKEGQPCWMKGMSACIYGPWVMEAVHEWKTEIHPLDAFWTVRPAGNREQLDATFFIDGSKRFSKDGQFWGDGRGPVWAPENRRAQIRLPYRAEAAGPASIEVSSKTWTDSGSSVAPADRTLIQNSGLTLRGPAGVFASTADVCTSGGIQQGIVSLSVDLRRNLDAARAGAALRLSVERPALPRPAAGAATEIARRRLPPEASPQGVRLRLEPVATDYFGDPNAPVNAPSGITAYWGTAELTLAATSVIHLRGQVRYHGEGSEAEGEAERLNKMFAECVEASCQESIQVTWQFDVKTTDAPPGQQIGISSLRTNYGYGVAISGGWLIDSETSLPVRPQTLGGSDPDRPDRWQTLLRIEAPHSALDRFAPASAILRISATLRDRENRGGTFGPLEIPTHSPTFARSENASTVLAGLSEFLSRRLPEELRGLPAPPALLGILRSDWDTTRPDPLIEPPPHRLARTLNLWIRAIAADGLVTADELNEVRSLARTYASARWPQ